MQYLYLLLVTNVVLQVNDDDNPQNEDLRGSMPTRGIMLILGRVVPGSMPGGDTHGERMTGGPGDHGEMKPRLTQPATTRTRGVAAGVKARLGLQALRVQTRMATQDPENAIMEPMTAVTQLDPEGTILQMEQLGLERR